MSQTATEPQVSDLDPGAISARLAISVLQRTAPAALERVTARIRGITLLLIGPSGAGKTAFFDYLNYGLLLPESEHVTTVQARSSGPLALSIGKDARLKLRVRRSTDPPGQHGPMAHADLIGAKRPHAVLLILDSTAPVPDLKAWVSEFCKHAERVFGQSSAHKRKIRSFIVCLNKADKSRSPQHFSARHRAVRECLVEGLAAALGNHYVQSIPILRCVSVLTSQDKPTLLIDTAIAKLALQVREKK